jgi:peptide/nickel transport system substrate-binding protein
MKLTACFALALLAFSACTRVGSANRFNAALHSWTEPDTVRIGLYEEPDTLNPVIGTMSFSSDVFQLVFDGLIRYDDHGRPIPDLAREVPSLENGGISPDGRTLTYHLMPNARWSDGVPVTADDVIFTWHAIMNPQNLTISRDGYDRITSMDAPDPHTVRVHLREVYPPALYLFADGIIGAIVPKHILGAYPNVNRVPFNAAPIGSGPFILRSWEHGNAIRLDANDAYFRGRPKLRHVVLRFIPDQNTLISQLRSHEIDLYYNVSLQQMAQVQTIRDVNITHANSTLHWEHINFNVRHAPLDERAVRLALCYAFDERVLLDKIYHGYGRAAPTHFNPDFGWGDPRVGYYPYDPRRAGALLDAAGWKLGSDGIRSKNGKPLSFGMTTVAGVKQREAIEVYLQNAWRAVGADAIVKNAAAPTLFAPAGSGGLLLGGKTDVTVFAYENNNPDPDDTAYLNPKSLPPNGQNTTFYVNPEIARLETAGLSSFDPRIRRPAYERIDQILIRDVPEYVLDWLPEIDVASVDLHGLRPVPIGSDLWNVAEWSLGPASADTAQAH